MARALAELVEAGNNPQKYIGMWCDNLISTAKNPSLVVLSCVQGENCWVIHTDLNGEWSNFSLDCVAPRPDLPRAWTPEGKPVAGGWEHAVGHVIEDKDGSQHLRPKYLEQGRAEACKEAAIRAADGYVAMTRHMTEWEKA